MMGMFAITEKIKTKHNFMVVYKQHRLLAQVARVTGVTRATPPVQPPVGVTKADPRGFSAPLAPCAATVPASETGNALLDDQTHWAQSYGPQTGIRSSTALSAQFSFLGHCSFSGWRRKKGICLSMTRAAILA